MPPPTSPSPSSPLLHGGTVALKPGPWGKIEWVPMSIAPSNELLPVRAIEGETVHWFFGGMSRDELVHFFGTLDLPGGDRERLLSPLVLQVSPKGIDLTPPRDIIISLPAKARREIYMRLAFFPENDGYLTFFHTASVDDRLQKANISSETLALFHKLSCPNGEYTILSGLPSLLSAIPSYEAARRSTRRAPPPRRPRSRAVREGRRWRSRCSLRRSQMSSSVGYRCLGVGVVSISCPARSCVMQVIKKSGSRAGPTLTNRSKNRPL